MKRIVCVLACICLSGCVSKNEPPPVPKIEMSSITPTEDTSASAETINDSFNGFTDAGESPHIRNTMSCLNRNGILYSSNELIYGDVNGDLKKGNTVLSKNVSPTCLNVDDDKIYYINGNDNKIYCITEEQNCSIYLDVQAVFFAMTDEYFVYKDIKNSLYINRDSNSELISDKNVLWVDIYGKYIIYCELANGCQVKAFDTQSGNVTPLLDYGFFPSVHGDTLYYQEKEHGYILKLDLLTGEISTAVNQWGQQFSFVNDQLYYINSRGIHSASRENIYIPDNGITVESLFECGGELFFTEKADVEKIYKLDTVSGERILIE